MITVPSFEKCQLSKREPYWTRQRAVVIGNQTEELLNKRGEKKKKRVGEEIDQHFCRGAKASEV